MSFNLKVAPVIQKMTRHYYCLLTVSKQQIANLYCVLSACSFNYWWTRPIWNWQSGRLAYIEAHYLGLCIFDCRFILLIPFSPSFSSLKWQPIHWSKLLVYWILSKSRLWMRKTAIFIRQEFRVSSCEEKAQLWYYSTSLPFRVDLGP